MTFGERLKHYRLLAGMTLMQVAERTGVSEATIQRYESGVIKNPPQDRLTALARAVGVSESMLMGWEESSPEEDEEFRMLAYRMRDADPKTRRRIYSVIRVMLDQEEADDRF